MDTDHARTKEFLSSNSPREAVLLFSLISSGGHTPSLALLMRYIQDDKFLREFGRVTPLYNLQIPDEEASTNDTTQSNACFMLAAEPEPCPLENSYGSGPELTY